ALERHAAASGSPPAVLDAEGADGLGLRVGRNGHIGSDRPVLFAPLDHVARLDVEPLIRLVFDLELVDLATALLTENDGLRLHGFPESDVFARVRLLSADEVNRQILMLHGPL